MLVWRLNLAWKSGDPNQCLRLGDDAKADRALGARFRESASHGSALSVNKPKYELRRAKGDLHRLFLRLSGGTLIAFCF